MIFVRTGIHLITIGDHDVINIQPNPKFSKNNRQYGAIMLNQKYPIGIYPLTSDDMHSQTVYDVYDSIIRQIQNADTTNVVITLPASIKFDSIDEYEDFKDKLKKYDKNEMIDIYYNSLNQLKGN